MWPFWFFGTPTAEPAEPTVAYQSPRNRDNVLLFPQGFTLGNCKPVLWLDGTVNVAATLTAVSAWRGRQAGAAADTTFYQLTAGKKPTYSTVAGYLSFDGGDSMVCQKELTGTRGRVFAVVAHVLSAADQVMLCCTDVTAAASYAAFGINSDQRIWMSLKNEGVDDYQLSGNTILANETKYLLEWNSNGSFCEMWINGAEETLSVTGTNAGKWMTASAGTGQILGELRTSAGASLNWGGFIYEIFVVEPDLSPANVTRVRRKLAAKHSITLA